MPRASKREQLIQVALELFSRDGFHAVGIDAISKQAKVTKKTLYHHFRSKDELILAVLHYYDERFRNNFMRAVEARASDPAGRLLAIFDVAKEWFSQKNFYGCLFVSAMGEYPEAGCAIRNACRESKNLLKDYVRSLTEEASLSNPGELAEQLVLLLEGAITLAQVKNSPSSASLAKKAAGILIEHHKLSPEPRVKKR